ncbi:hypothetical protein B9479_008060 [Cryptococcus floricola]|uniref:Uncharacterized protein n=1 Tax=Cryptococcus floricola TaxID=2591691 RepID=A0A5D3AL40_9TREE|nr:hypothetical protein B9479_008060 [Cryptococcus floricola]
MSSITPVTFAALHPVHHLIFEELVASAPHSALRLCSSTYKRVIPLLYVDIYPSPAVFEGLRWNSGDERTMKALQNTRTLKICDFASLNTLYELAGQEPESHTIPSPSAPSHTIEAIPRYPYIYDNIFPNLERLEFGFPVLRESVDGYFNMFSPEDPGPLDREKILFQCIKCIKKLLSSNIREVVIYLDEEGEEYWNKALHLLHTTFPSTNDAAVVVSIYLIAFHLPINPGTAPITTLPPLHRALYSIPITTTDSFGRRTSPNEMLSYFEPMEEGLGMKRVKRTMSAEWDFSFLMRIRIKTAKSMERLATEG